MSATSEFTPSASSRARCPARCPPRPPERLPLVGTKRVSKAGASDLESAAKNARARRTSDPADSRGAARTAKAKADLAREKRLAKHLKAEGRAPTRVTTKRSMQFSRPYSPASSRAMADDVDLSDLSRGDFWRLLSVGEDFEDDARVLVRSNETELYMLEVPRVLP